ncbi:MAG: hypothetical protein KatS3mg083_506 [Candidatus Dojkabacteria bacterium]|nr:MAG: hypothetical protein KatS3mg083_506 [Candidatus Dojkabacteria bacterium]
MLLFTAILMAILAGIIEAKKERTQYIALFAFLGIFISIMAEDFRNPVLYITITFCLSYIITTIIEKQNKNKP